MTSVDTGIRKPGMREAAIRLLRFFRLNRSAARFYYRWVHGFSSATRDLPDAVDRCIERLAASDHPVSGDYFEFGVFKGYTFLRAFQAAQAYGLDNMRFFGFDSFAGIPPISGVDEIADAPFYEGQFAWPLERVTNDLDKRGLDWDRCELIQGYFENSLTSKTRSKFNMQHAAVALIDCDLYHSAAAALDFLTELVVDGSILIFDDWNAFDRISTRGERRAFSEFMDMNPQWRAEPWFSYGLYGQVFVLRSSQQTQET